MVETAAKVPVKTGAKEPAAPGGWPPFENLRREMERAFDDLRADLAGSPFRPARLLEPLWRREASWGAIPAVDIVEKDKSYEITAELPGMDEKSVEVKLANGALTVRGEKQAEKEEKKKDYYLRERSFGAFERTFTVPEGVDVDKIDASFRKGVLTVTLPKKPEAIKPEKKIDVKTAS